MRWFVFLSVFLFLGSVSALPLFEEQTQQVNHFIQGPTQDPGLEKAERVTWTDGTRYEAGLGNGLLVSVLFESEVPIYDLILRWEGQGVQMRVTFDNGSTWCGALSGHSLLDGDCAGQFPISTIQYEADLAPEGSIDVVTMEWSATEGERLLDGGGPCEPVWECSPSWGPCIDGLQTRECVDSNGCGEDVPRGLVAQVCGVEEDSEFSIPRPSSNVVWLVGGVILGVVFLVGVVWALVWFANKRAAKAQQEKLYRSARKGAFGEFLRAKE